MLNKSIDPDNIPKWLAKIWARKNYTNIIAGINDDDCAIIKLSDTENLIITTDFLNANPISVELGICDTKDLGRLLVASNISDLCGTGAKPLAFLVGVTMEKNDSEEELTNFFEGVKIELDKLSIPLVGGDTKLGKARAFLGTAIGTANSERKLFLKNSAEPDDIIWVSGNLGGISAAVYGVASSILAKDLLEDAHSLILKSEVPLLKSESVAIAKIGNGGTDISDGLGSDLHNMLDSSNVGAEIIAEKIPYNSLVSKVAQIQNIEPWLFSFIIGGDFQFIVTTKTIHRSKMVDFGFIEIGKILGNKERNLIFNNTKYNLPNLGHRDGRKQSFKEEVSNLIGKLNNQIFRYD